MNRKIIVITIILLLMWAVMIYLFVNYGKEVRQHPCSVCARKMGDDVICTTTGASKVFYENGSTELIRTFESPFIILNGTG